MATPTDLLNEVEIAKTYISSSDFSDDYKRVFLKLLNTSTVATNGITSDQKIQKMTESICLLAQTQVMLMKNVNDKITSAIATANEKQCEKCKAMKHANAEEDLKKREMLIEQLKQDGVIRVNESQIDSIDDNVSWNDVFKSILTKPWLYMFLSIATFSPHICQILDKVIAFYSK